MDRGSSHVYPYRLAVSRNEGISQDSQLTSRIFLEVVVWTPSVHGREREGVARGLSVMSVIEWDGEISGMIDGILGSGIWRGLEVVEWDLREGGKLEEEASDGEEDWEWMMLARW